MLPLQLILSFLNLFHAHLTQKKYSAATLETRNELVVTSSATTTVSRSIVNATIKNIKQLMT